MASSDTLTAASCLLLLLLAIVAHFFFGKNERHRSADEKKQHYNFPPGPPHLPIIGNLHQLLLHRRRPPLFRILSDLSRDHGGVMHLQLGGVRGLVVSSVDAAKEVMKLQDHTFCSRAQLAATKVFSYGGLDVATAPYGEHWRELRKLYVLELLSTKKILGFQPARAEEVARMVQSIRTQIADGGGDSAVVDLSVAAVRLSNTITCRVAFGKRDPGGGGGYSERSKFHTTLLELQAMAGTLFLEDLFPGSILAQLGDRLTGLWRRTDAVARELDSFYEEVIKEHVDRRHSAAEQSDQQDFIDILLGLKEQQPHLTKTHIKAALMNVLVAGTDTTSATVTWAMAELMNNPRVMKKAVQEVRSCLKNITDGGIREEDLQKLHYLKCLVSEVMRLHPPLPLLIPRETVQHAAINGYDVAANTRVFVNVWAMGRDPAYWDNPEEFYPERFTGGGAAVDYKGQCFQFLPFGSGRRICPGMQLGVVTTELALASLLHAFDWELPQQPGTGGEAAATGRVDMEEADGIVVQKKAALHLIAKPNNELVV